MMIDYWPRRLDIAALKAGSLAEVTLLAPKIATFKRLASLLLNKIDFGKCRQSLCISLRSKRRRKS